MTGPHGGVPGLPVPGRAGLGFDHGGLAGGLRGFDGLAGFGSLAGLRGFGGFRGLGRLRRGRGLAGMFGHGHAGIEKRSGDQGQQAQGDNGKDSILLHRDWAPWDGRECGSPGVGQTRFPAETGRIGSPQATIWLGLYLRPGGMSKGRGLALRPTRACRRVAFGVFDPSCVTGCLNHGRRYHVANIPWLVAGALTDPGRMRRPQFRRLERHRAHHRRRPSLRGLPKPYVLIRGASLASNHVRS